MDKKSRNLSKEEVALIQHLLKLATSRHANSSLPNEVYSMNDDEVGSLLFGERLNREYSRDVIEANYIDADKVHVLITLTEDLQGNLFELDFWKYDFSELKEYPAPNKVFL